MPSMYVKCNLSAVKTASRTCGEFHRLRMMPASPSAASVSSSPPISGVSDEFLLDRRSRGDALAMIVRRFQQVKCRHSHTVFMCVRVKFQQAGEIEAEGGGGWFGAKVLTVCPCLDWLHVLLSFSFSHLLHSKSSVEYHEGAVKRAQCVSNSWKWCKRFVFGTVCALGSSTMKCADW